jgi:hypothetical protein
MKNIVLLKMLTSSSPVYWSSCLNDRQRVKNDKLSQLLAEEVASPRTPNESCSNISVMRARRRQRLRAAGQVMQHVLARALLAWYIPSRRLAFKVTTPSRVQSCARVYEARQVAFHDARLFLVPLPLLKSDRGHIYTTLLASLQVFLKPPQTSSSSAYLTIDSH